MAQGKTTYEIKDDQQNVSAVFERQHNPKGFRPHEILRVTVPMLAKVQAKEPQATTVKKAWYWLCQQAGISVTDADMDSRPVEQRVKAAADTTEDPIAVAVLDAIKHGKTAKEISQAMKRHGFSQADIDKYLPELKKPKALSFI